MRLLVPRLVRSPGSQFLPPPPDLFFFFGTVRCVGIVPPSYEVCVPLGQFFFWVFLYQDFLVVQAIGSSLDGSF